MTPKPMSVHWHANGYTGKGYTDSEVGKGLAPPSFPPVEIKDWLQRKPLRIFTEEQIDEATAWLKKELGDHEPLDAESFPITTRVEYSRARLMERANRDVVYGYWSKRGQYVARSLILCRGAACPNGTPVR